MEMFTSKLVTDIYVNRVKSVLQAMKQDLVATISFRTPMSLRIRVSRVNREALNSIGRDLAVTVVLCVTYMKSRFDIAQPHKTDSAPAKKVIIVTWSLEDVTYQINLQVS